MGKYKIQLSIKAKNDYKKIINYLKNELLEPKAYRVKYSGDFRREKIAEI